MPFWWKRAQWQEQFPRDATRKSFANMEVIRADYKPDDTIRYCPAWSAANKPGRPAKGKRKLSALKTAQGMKRTPKHLTRFCQICRGFSHRAINCWFQEKNKEYRPKAWKGQLAQEMHEELEEAEVEEARRISADPLPVGGAIGRGVMGTRRKKERRISDSRMLFRCLDYTINYFSEPFASIHKSLLHFSRQASRQALHRSASRQLGHPDLPLPLV